MAIIEMDADKIKIEGDNLKTISKDYLTLLGDMYKEIRELVNSGGWKSLSDNGSANVYLQMVMKSKPNMLSLASSINSLGGMIIDYADKMNESADNTI